MTGDRDRLHVLGRGHKLLGGSGVHIGPPPPGWSVPTAHAAEVECERPLAYPSRALYKSTYLRSHEVKGETLT